MPGLDPVWEEQQRLEHLRALVDGALDEIRRGRVPAPEVEERIADLRWEAERLFPDKGDVFDLVYRPRLERAAREGQQVWAAAAAGRNRLGKPKTEGHLALPQNIVVYLRPECTKCEQVVRYLGRRGLRVQVRDIEGDAAALADLNALGYTERDAPVTFLDDTAIVGFDTNRLDAALVHITL